MQRSKAAEAVESAAEAHVAEAPSISAPPGMEVIARPDRKPAEAAPSAITEAETKAAAPSPERYISGRPEGVVASVDRTGPPCPRTAIPEPASIVIRRP